MAALWFAGRASDLIRYLILAQLLAFALEPAVMWLHQRRPAGCKNTADHAPRTADPMVVEGCRDDGVGIRATDDHAGALPEICQKLRYV